MGFFSSLFGGKQRGESGLFRSDAAYAQNRAKQLAMTPQTMAQLRTFGVSDTSQLKLEYFFYTNTKEKAAALAQALTDLGYEGGHGVSAGSKKEFVIKGWTAKMPMDNQTVLDWTASMCDVGKQHDCDFDGWGTNPTQ